MACSRRIMCLASFKKVTGRCVAGLEVVGPNLKRWIRPVSAGPPEDGRGLPLHHRQSRSKVLARWRRPCANATIHVMRLAHAA